MRGKEVAVIFLQLFFYIDSMQRVALLNWENISQDYDLAKIFKSLASSWVVEWLEVQTWKVTAGYGFIDVTRDSETFPILFQNTAELVIDTTWTKKVFIEITQANVDDWINNSSNWTWIWEIKTAVSYPLSNYIKLASITSWVITDEREFIDLKNPLVTKMWNAFNWVNQLIKTDENWKLPALDGSNITWLQAEVNSTSLKYMLWDPWVVWKAYSLVDYEQTIYWTSNNFWSIAQPKISQSFFAQWDIDFNNFKLMLKKVSSPSDWIIVTIETDNAWSPSWILAPNWVSDTVSYTSIWTNFTEVSFNFTNIPVLNTEEYYHIVIKRSWANDAVNYYSIWSAWSDRQIWECKTHNWSTWSAISDDLYFKIPWYKLLILWWTNFIWILQIAWSVWQFRKANTSYDNNQSWLIPWNYYTYDISTWNLTTWNDLRAISETEIAFDSSALWIDLFYWNWWDWDLEVLSWTTNLPFWVYNYSSIKVASWATLQITGSNSTLELYCSRLCEIDGTVSLVWLWNDGSKVLFNGSTLTPWNWWSWGAWWNWGSHSINGYLAWASWWAWSGAWYGWWWGWGAADSQSWGSGWAGWYPWWLWGYGSCDNSGWDAYWNPWSNANWNWTYTQNSWWTSAWGSGGCSNGAWWGGWAGWTLWWKWWNIIIKANEVKWAWIITVQWSSGWNWWKWGNANWWGWGWWGWWGGGWGWGWAIICTTNNSNYNLISNWWSWGSWWVWGTASWSYSPTNWSNWWGWTTWGSWTFSLIIR